MIRSKGEAGTGNIVEAVRHLRSILGDIRRLTQADSAEQYGWAKELAAPIGLVQEIAATGRLPVPLFCAGGIATPADASLVMQLGAEAVFVGSGIFKSSNPSRMARAIVEATAHFTDADLVAKVSTGLGDAMAGQEIEHARRAPGRAWLVTADPADSAEDGRRWRSGVLALQGDVREHVAALESLGEPVRAGARAERPRRARRADDSRR